MSNLGSEEKNPDGVETLKAYGRYMRELRKRSGLSLRKASESAKVDKNTILRLEAGLPIRKGNRDRICLAYGVLNIEPESIPRKESGAHFARSHRDSHKWYRMRLGDPEAPSDVTTSEEIQSQAERLRQGRLKLAQQFFTRLECDMVKGRMRSGVFEVFGPSGFSSQKSGEALVFMLQGTLRFFVGNEEFIVSEGEAATFDRTIRHMHEPYKMSVDELPAVMLYVQTD